nr:IHF alpha=integration host factor-like protein alpha subunit {N-terminal} [Pseudomonas aeruginosa, CHA, Peptide Partial, 15 aa] [Pseudomonas aeruginosa]
GALTKAEIAERLYEE